MRFQAYPNYKPSGVEWLGDVPAHWDVKRLSYLVTLKSGENITSEMIAEGGDYPVYGGNGLRGNYHKFTHCGHHALIGRQGALCGNINYASGEFWASEHALVVSPLKEIAVGWMGELLRAMNLGQYSVTAAQPGIAAEMIRGLRIPIPPLTEQQAIAAFLDWETGRVDRMVAKKRELIERLKEKRTALISRTITRGLPPAAALAAGLPANPPLKPSALDWLGDIPEHWTVKAIKWETPVKRGASPRPIDDEKFFDDEGEYAWVRIADVTAGGVYLEKTEQRMSPLGSSLSVKLKPGALFLSIAGTVGKPCITSIKCCIHDGFVYFPTWKGDTKFLFYIFASGEPYKGLGKMGTQLNLNTDTVGSIRIGVPPLPEQSAIAAYLDEETAKLGALVGKVEEAVERLQEYRIALITAAVTGKISVVTK